VRLQPTQDPPIRSFAVRKLTGAVTAAVAAVVAGFLLPGCGGSVEEKHDFKPVDTTPFKGMEDMMIKNMKTKSLSKGSQAKPDETPPADEKKK
jgi:hypothetical protein